MAQEPMNIVLEHLRLFRTDMAGMRGDINTLILRVGAVERILSGHTVEEFQQNAEIDRLKARVERIERRLELSE